MCYSSLQTVRAENIDGLVLASEWNNRVFGKSGLVIAVCLLILFVQYICSVSWLQVVMVCFLF
jgi:hypothetical protein